MAGNVFATPGQVSLEWDASTETNLLAYRVYYGMYPGLYTNFYEVDADTLTVTIDHLVPGVMYYFAATAVDDRGMESDYSNEVAQQAPGEPVLPPSVELVVPGSGAAFEGPVNIFLSAKVLSNGHGVEWLEFLSGDQVIGEIDQEPYAAVWENVGPGTYLVRARLTFDAGNWIDSEPTLVTVRDPKAALNGRLSDFLNAVFYSPVQWPESVGAALPGLAGDQSSIASIFATLSLDKWAWIDPAAAATWVSQLPPGTGRSESIRCVASAWCRVDLESGLAWLRALPDENREEIESSVLHSIAETGDKAMDPLPVSTGREQLFLELISEWTVIDPDGVAAYLDALRSNGPAPGTFFFNAAAPFTR